MPNWDQKTRNYDLFYCLNIDCNVITFRTGPVYENECPKCHTLGSIVRTARVLPLGIPQVMPVLDSPNEVE